MRLYVIRTSESDELLSAEDTVRSYKNFAHVERVFRSFKGITFWTLAEMKKGLPVRNPLICLVAGARFELATFGL